MRVQAKPTFQLAVILTFALGASSLRGADGQVPLKKDLFAQKQSQWLTLDGAKPNAIQRGKRTLAGIAIQVRKTRNPLNLINPLASRTYGSGFANLTSDSVSGGAPGLKIISLEF